MNHKELIDLARKKVGLFTLGQNGSAGSVAAALLTKSNNLYTGICIDLPSGIGFCAEHAAISEMLKNRETEIEMIVAVTDNKIYSPCGRCREMLYQINNKNLKAKIIISEEEIITLEELLPFRN